MMIAEDLQVESYVTRRMLRYCKEAGMNYYESIHALHLPADEREKYESDWLEA